MNDIFEKISFLIIKIITFDYYVIKREISFFKGKSKKVLDLGSGNGYLSKFFSRSGYEGYELDKFLVTKAKVENKGYKFFQADITLLNLKKKFELVIIIGVIHHLDNDQFKKLLLVVNKHLLKDCNLLIIEAIPPISKYNILGRIFRALDKGEYIRNFEKYKKILQLKFKIKVSKKMRGGLVDYALFYASKKNS